jgi:membrane-bound serine protease (ClpP class)
VGDEPIEIPGILPKLPGTWAALQQGLLIVVGGMICSLALWVWLQRYLPRLPYLNRLILTTTSGDLVVANPTFESGGTWPVVGSRGRVVTDLRPGGTAAFRDESISDDRITDVVSDSGFVPAGREVVVREVRGSHVVVRAAGDA